MFRKFLAWTSAKLALIHFATRHHAFLSTSSVFYDIFAQAYAKIKLFVSNVFRLFGFLILFPQFFFSFSYLFAAVVAICLLILFSAFSFFSFSYLFAAVVDLLLLVQKFPRLEILTMEQPRVVKGYFALSSHKFLNIFGHISHPTDPVTLIRVSLESSFPPRI